jgi:hypothetical protein
MPINMVFRLNEDGTVFCETQQMDEIEAWCKEHGKDVEVRLVNATPPTKPLAGSEPMRLGFYALEGGADVVDISRFGGARPPVVASCRACGADIRDGQVIPVRLDGRHSAYACSSECQAKLVDHPEQFIGARVVCSPAVLDPKDWFMSDTGNPSDFEHDEPAIIPRKEPHDAPSSHDP